MTDRLSTDRDTAGCVLTNPHFVKLITSFQSGLPKELFDFAVRCYPDWNAIASSQRRQRVRLLGVEVMRRGDLRLLQLAAQVQFYEPVGRQVVARRIALPIQHAIENQRPAMVRWIFTERHDPLVRQSDLWNDAIANFNGQYAILEELKTLLDVKEAETVEIQVCYAYRLLDCGLLRWIHEKIPNVRIPVIRLMSEAVDSGRLGVVRFLHEKYPEQTFRSDMYCRALASGALDVLEFLLENRSEPLDDRFLKRAIESGNLEALKMVQRQCQLRVDTSSSIRSRPAGPDPSGVKSETGHVALTG